MASLDYFNKSDLRKKAAIDRLIAAVNEGLFDERTEEVLEGILHDLFSWSPEAAARIDTDPVLEYLKDE